MSGAGEPDHESPPASAAQEAQVGEGEPNPIDRLVEIGVFAPLGFALEFRRLLPELAEAGRKQIELSQSLGRAAIRAVSRGAQRPRSATATGDDRDARGAAEIEGFDQMTAREIVALLRTADEATVAWVGRRERQSKQRVTVLRAVEAHRART